GHARPLARVDRRALVVLLAAILPLFVHNRTYQTVQQVLNVAVLGFWSGYVMRPMQVAIRSS
ncbi:MAG: hypothetical protein ACFN22_03210, partial [Porphyromonas pasteri]